MQSIPIRQFLAIRVCTLTVSVLIAGVLTPGASSAEADPAKAAERLLQAGQVTGGLVVHVGCGDGAQTVELRLDERFLVQGLDASRENVDAARRRIRAAGTRGPISFDTWRGPNLPYVDNCVNLLVVSGQNGNTLSQEEVLRVLVPNGVALLEGSASDDWETVVKPRPADIDDWTHVLYNAGGNAVSKDLVAGPPRRLQWSAGPKWTRHHESMSSFQALVSANGRIFYLIDEGPQVSLFLPSDWRLIARDAFNGKLLWKKPFDGWVTQFMNYKSGPTQSTRRLVAVGDRVFVTPGLSEGLHVLDAASGETLRVLPETAACEEILFHDGLLYLITSDQPNLYPETTRFGRNDWRGQEKWIRAVDPESGEHLWDVPTPVAPMSFAVTNRGVVFHDGKQIRCLDRHHGAESWRSEPVLLDEVIPTSTTPTLVSYDDVILFIGGKDHGDYRGTGGHYVSQNLQTFTAISADTGESLWSYKVPRTGFECPKDILVLDGLVWIGAIFDGKESGAFTGRDLHTGEVVREFTPPWDIYWFHQRCYRSKATKRFIMPSRTGTEFISPTEGWISYNHWVRGACLYGMMPANGLLYQPTHPCGCYMESLLHGFNALAPAADVADKVERIDDGERLQPGPAHDRASRPSRAIHDEWPTFRHDPRRSGHSSNTIPGQVAGVWKTKVGATLTALTVADGKVFTADRDRHTVYAMDAATGKPAWEFTAGGRVDSPPTIAAGRALFGCRDGYVYCLDTADGALVWRYLAAPEDKRLLVDDQLESVWPLHGSVLVVDERVYCVAGRSMFLDGGLRLLVLNLETGQRIAANTMDDIDPSTGLDLQLKMQDRNLPVAMPDILSWDGERIYMKSQVFTLDGKRLTIETSRDAKDQTGETAHLFAPAGFLDDTAFHRVLMIYGKTFTGGAGSNHAAPKFAPAGKMLVFDESTVYGFSRMPHLHRWVRELEFHLYAADKRPVAGAMEPEHIHAGDNTPVDLSLARKSLTSTAVRYRWSSHDPSLFGRAMVLAGETLFVAGPPAIRNERSQDALQRWRGQKGGLLWALSREDGSRLAEHELPFAPVFDGMAAAYGRLYVALADGSVVCLGAG